MRIFRHVSFGLTAMALWTFGPAAPARADDPAQICMFRCAPVLGTKGYDQCVSDCFAEEEGAPAASAGVDFTPIHGSWRGEPAACGRITEDGWEIDASGASAYELSCKLLSSSRDGDTFVLDQSCEYYGDVEETSLSIRLVRKNEIEIDGARYHRCRR